MKSGEYSIIELKKSWKASKESNGLEVNYNISKELCKTIEEVKMYIKEEIEGGKDGK